jgi:hypothetical protein
VDQVAFLDVVATAQPGSAHAAAVEGQREGALDDLGSEFEGRFGDAREQSAAVGVDGVSGLVVTMPAQDATLAGRWCIFKPALVVSGDRVPRVVKLTLSLTNRRERCLVPDYWMIGQQRLCFDRAGRWRVGLDDHRPHRFY